ncbi:Ff.00g052420.m01.CDS01 [Fusarium sp. VM40]|nr:Ff.00g052420.m01.CDS01 [Fusarium sp. VM40]
MHILLLLTTSDRKGSLILKSALSRNYTVTVLTPRPSYLPYHANATLIAGSPTSQYDLEAALQTPTSPEAVILAFDRAGVLEMSTRALLSAVESVHRLHDTSKALHSHTSLPFRLVFSPCDATPIRAEAYHKVDAIVRESGLPFVLAPRIRLAREPIETLRVSPCDGRGATWLAAINKGSTAHLLAGRVQENMLRGKTWFDGTD